jgi:hypothetical protein
LIAAITPVAAAVVTGGTSAVTVVSTVKRFLARSYLGLTQSAWRFDCGQSRQISAPQLASALQFLQFEHSQQELAVIREA